MADTVTTPPATAATGSSLIERLIYISKLSRALDNCRLPPLGIFPGQDECILTLETEVPKTISDVAAQLSVNVSTVSKMAERLEKAGLVSRDKDRQDHRLALLRITEQGQRVRLQVEAQRQKTADEFSAAYGPKRAKEIARALSIVDVAIRKRTARARQAKINCEAGLTQSRAKKV